MVEWGILALVVLGIAWSLGYYAQHVHALAERAAVISTLGALRTSLVVQQITPTTRPATPRIPASMGNPFDSLERYPPNYAGEVQGRNVSAVSPGQWAFDPQCQCIGYKPLYPQDLQSLEQLGALWFQQSRLGTAILLTPLDHYVWHGSVVQ